MAEKLGKAADIAAGTGKGFDVGGKRIAVFNVGGAFHAIDAVCTHQGGPLDEGELKGTMIVCPWHGGRFDVRTGAVQGPPPRENVASHKVTVKDGELYVELAKGS